MEAKRKVITLSQKLEIILDIENGKKQSQVAIEKSLPPCTVSSIWKKREKIKHQHDDFNPDLKKVRKSAFPQIDEALLKWLDTLRAQNIPVNGILLQAQAKDFAKKFGVLNFCASNGWLDKWKRRHNVSFQSVCGEEGAVDDTVIQNWLSSIWPKLRQGYKDEDIFNCDETGLFYKCLPNKTMNRKGLRCAGGKLSKERVSVLFCTNATGSEKLKPMVIGKFENPRCFKNVKKHNLPIDYQFNRSSWMTQEIFGEWLRKLDLKMRFKRRHILLLLDNCTPHKVTIKTPNIKIVFLPPNVTSKLQPLDLGIIKTTKGYYRTRVVRKIITLLEKNESLSIDLLDGIMILGAAWKDLKQSAIANCYRKSKLIGAESQDDAEIEFEPMEISENELDVIGISEENMEAFLHVDDDLVAFEEPNADDIVEEIVRCEETRDDSEGEDDPIINRAEFNQSEAAEGISRYRTWYLSQDIEENEVHKSLIVLEDFLVKRKLQNLKQTTLRDYFASNK